MEVEYTAFCTHQEALEYAHSFDNVYVDHREVVKNTDSFEIPDGVESWWGDIGCLAVYDTDTKKLVAYVGYWYKD